MDLRPALLALVIVPGAAGHGVGVHIDRIDRVADGHDIIYAQNVADVAAVAFGAVGDENLVLGDLHAPGAEVVLCNGMAQELVALLRAVALEGLLAGHLVHRFMHGGDDRRDKRQGDVADTHFDELCLRVLRSVGGGAPGDLGEQVAAGQLLIIGVDFSQWYLPPIFYMYSGQSRSSST